MTSIPVEKSQADIRAAVMRYLNRGYSIEERVEDDGTEQAVVQFARGEIVVRIVAEVELPDSGEIMQRSRRARTKTAQEIEQEFREQNRKQTWHAIAGSVRARLHAVDRGVSTFEQAFLADIVSSDGKRTVFEVLRASGEVPALNA